MTKRDVKDPSTWIPKAVFAAYVGDDSTKLLAYYDAAKAKRNPMRMSFDLFALLAFPAWLAYRRQWALWCTLVGLICLVPFVEDLAAIRLPLGAFSGVWIALGTMARGLLLLTATGRYQRLKEQQLSDAEIASAMHGGAAGRVGLAVAGGVGAMVAPIAASLLADAAIGLPMAGY